VIDFRVGDLRGDELHAIETRLLGKLARTRHQFRARLDRDDFAATIRTEDEIVEDERK